MLFRSNSSVSDTRTITVEAYTIPVPILSISYKDIDADGNLTNKGTGNYTASFNGSQTDMATNKYIKFNGTTDKITTNLNLMANLTTDYTLIYKVFDSDVTHLALGDSSSAKFIDNIETASPWCGFEICIYRGSTSSNDLLGATNCASASSKQILGGGSGRIANQQGFVLDKDTGVRVEGLAYNGAAETVDYTLVFSPTTSRTLDIGVQCNIKLTYFAVRSDERRVGKEG